MSDVAWRSLRFAGSALAQSRLDLAVEGVDNIPASGPVIIAARHFHHLYDGAAIVATVPRPMHILVGLDWVRSPAGKMLMNRLCKAVAWPVVLRRDGRLASDDGQASRALRKAVVDSLDVLQRGHGLVVFPEGYPNIDPGYTPKTDEASFLPFQPGVVQLAVAARAKGLQVPIVPAGFCYQRGPRWEVTLRFGEPVEVLDRRQQHAVLKHIEDSVHELSAVL